VVAGGVLSSALEGVGISLLVPLLATMMPGGNLAGIPGPLARVANLAAAFDVQQRLLLICGGIFALILLKAGVQSLNATFLAWVDTRIGHEVRSALSHRLLMVGYPFFLDHDPGRLVTIISTDSWRVSEAVRLAFSLLIGATALVVFGVLMALVSWKLLVGVALGTGLVRVLQISLVRHLHAVSERFAQANAVLANRMLLAIDAMRLIRLFGQEDREQRQFVQASDAVRRINFDLERASVLIPPALEVVQAALFIGVLLGAAALDIRMPVIVGFLVLLYRAEPHLRSLSQSRLGLASLRQSIREVEWLLDAAVAPAPAAAAGPSHDIGGAIAFDNVTFEYPNRLGAEPALRDVSFVLREGKSTALIGRSGSGKTTIVNMLCRFLRPTSGTIRVGGIDLADIDVQSWRRQIGLAGQDIDLIDGTVSENIAYGLPQAAREAVEDAARLADAEDFIRRLPDGYDTKVGSRGLSLSGGQRQRIGIARAIIRRPRVVIFDEATNAVDGISEAVIMSLLREHFQGITTIVVSHHATTLASCDDGIVIEDGRIVEMGPLKTLQVGRSLVLPYEPEQQAN